MVHKQIKMSLDPMEDDSYSPEYVPQEDHHYRSRPPLHRHGRGHRRPFYNDGPNHRYRGKIIEELKRSEVPIDEYELREMFPRIHIYRLLRSCQEVRFSRNTNGVRMWQFDKPEYIEKDILDSISEGAHTIEDIQRRVKRRFSTVRETLHRLSRNNEIEEYVQNDETYWTLNIPNATSPEYQE